MWFSVSIDAVLSISISLIINISSIGSQSTLEDVWLSARQTSSLHPWHWLFLLSPALYSLAIIFLSLHTLCSLCMHGPNSKVICIHNLKCWSTVGAAFWWSLLWTDSSVIHSNRMNHIWSCFSRANSSNTCDCTSFDFYMTKTTLKFSKQLTHMHVIKTFRRSLALNSLNEISLVQNHILNIRCVLLIGCDL